MAILDRRPGSIAARYGLIILLAFLLISLVRLVTGYAPFGGDPGYRLFSAFMFAFPAYLAHDLNRLAARVFQAFRDSLKDPEEGPALLYRLTTTPAVPALLCSLGGALIGVLIVLGAPQVETSMEDVFGPFAATALFGAGSWFINSHFAYRVTHQLLCVSRIYTRHTRVDLNHLDSALALSRISSRAAIASILVTSGYGIGFALTGDANLAVGILVPNFALVLIVFLLPLLGAHRLLASERDQRLRAVGASAGKAFAALEAAVDDGRFADVPPIKDAYHALDLERTRLAHIPTWPWAPGTLRGVLATGLLPILIWLIQFGLGRLLE